MTLTACAHQNVKFEYPEHWWKTVPKEGAPTWEILPQEAAPGEVILSKRNELGLFSNFTLATFEYRGKHYNSIEGLWQMMLYPEKTLGGKPDPRAKAKGVEWKHTRDEVSQMVAFEAKTAGDEAYKNMQTMKIDWVSFEGERFIYWTPEKGKQYKIIRAAMVEKLKQHSEIQKLLLSTGTLILKPDHHQETDPPPSWKYFEIWMELRDKLKSHQPLE